MDVVLSLPTLLILAPAAGGLIAISMLSRRAAALVSLATFAVQVALIAVGYALVRGGDIAAFAIGQRQEWLPVWNFAYDVRLDAPALGLIALTTLVTGCAGLFSWWADRERPAAAHGLLWLSSAALCGLFVARDLVLFYVFFELMLVPLFFLIGGWGGERRLRATMTMFVYTLVGSLPMLIGVLGVGLAGGTFELDALAAAAEAGDLSAPTWALASFLLAFAIKAPLLPLHGWMPMAYREAPIEATALLSGVVSKAAMFGMLVVVLPLFPRQMHGSWGHALTWVALASLLYASIAAFRQPDARGVIAYSSMAQMGLITLGLSVYMGRGGEQAMAGAYMQTINHGLISAALFLVAGIVERRAGTGQLARLGGLASGRPVFATIVLVLSLCALAVPGSNAFAGELMILVGAWRGPWEHAWIWAVLGSVAVVLAAMYALRLLSALLHSPSDKTAANSAATRERFGGDLRAAELAFLLPLLACILALSVWPNALRRAMNERPVNVPDATAITAANSAAQEANG